MAGRLRVLALIAGIVLMHGPELGAASPKPIHTNKTRFRIPFRFDSAAMDRMDAREIQLHVSRDQGITWEQVQSLAPDGGKFDYQSPAEGEYWFSVKTLDGRNQLHPPRGTHETGLIVVVDNSSPSLDLSLQQTGEGKVKLTWNASDNSLNVDSLHIDFITAESREWTPLNLVAQASGEHSWTVGSTGSVSVRGRISDLAGNIADARSQLSMTSADEPAPKPRQSRRVPIAEQPPLDVTITARSDSGAPEASPDNYEGPIITPNGGLPKFQKSISRESADDRWLGNAVPAENIPYNRSRTQSQPGNSNSQFISRQPAQQDPAANRRAPPRQKMVTTREFQIGYQLNAVGPSGIGAVELFITEDNGRKWWKYDNDPDQKSPFDVVVPRDGVYGFAIRVTNGAGLTNEPPVNGEPPEIFVAVDQTPPSVELLPVQQGRGSNANRVLIQWKTTEDHPSEKPVSLYYSARPNGPWEPITGWTEELSGSFEWVVGSTVPNQFYIRVLARDLAGNYGKAESQTATVVDLVRPTARLVDVETTAIPAPQ